MFPIPGTILDSLPDPVMLLDQARRVVAANRAAEDLLGESLIGHNLARALRHPDALAAADAVIAGEAQREVDVTLPVPVQRDFSVHVVSLAQGGDEVSIQSVPSAARAVIVLHDMTLARRAEQMRADFVANVSHELRSPLSALVGIIETLRGPAADDAEARSHFLEIMERESGRMARLIDDLLSLSRVEVNEHVPPRDQVDMASVLGHVAEFLEPRAAKKGVTLCLECPPGLPAVTGDADELAQVFQNLIDNAVKYGREGTPVHITAFDVERVPHAGFPGVGVTVEDQGEGIPKQDLPRLTERFYRVDKGRSRDVGGTGLGLAIVKHIVNRHRGRLYISSEEGAGTTVTVILPRLS